MSKTKWTDTKIKSLKIPKYYLLGDNLYLKVTKAGSKLWKYRRDYNGRRIEISFGQYPAVSLKEARQKGEAANLDFKKGIDHRETRNAAKYEKELAIKNTFSQWAEEWLKTKDNTPKTIEGIQGRLNNHILPALGHRPISDIDTPEVLRLLKKIESTGKLETVKRTRGVISQIFRYAIANGVCKYDPTYGLEHATKAPKSKNMVTIIDPEEIGQLLRDMDSYDGHITTKIALRVAPHLMLRPNEIRKAEWKFINFDTQQWRIPAEMMKMRNTHIIPLSTQTIELLTQLKNVTGNGKYLFPHISRKERTMSENTLNQALKNLGYANKIVSHGFRGMASTLLHENGFPSDIIEKQLAHNDKNSIRASYNHAEYLEKRSIMLQWWSDYLDNLAKNDLSIPERPLFAK